MTAQERTAWLEERKTGIGGSDAAVIMGVSPWKTQVSLWMEKTGRSVSQEETPAMRIGTRLEALVAEMYTEQTGRGVQRYNRMIHIGHRLGNFDRLVIPEGAKVASHQGVIRTDTVLECKTSKVDWNGEVPIYYLTQVQHYMGLSDELRHADVACLHMNHYDFEVLRVERDQEVIDAMTAQCDAWWDRHIIHDEMPTPVNEADCKLLWARSNPGKKVTATEEIKAKMDEYLEGKAEEDRSHARNTQLKNEIEAFMGDGEILVGIDGKPLLTWKSAKDSSVTDWEGAFNYMAMGQGITDASIKDITARFTTVKVGSRRFTPKTEKAA